MYVYVYVRYVYVLCVYTDENSIPELFIYFKRKKERDLST